MTKKPNTTTQKPNTTTAERGENRSLFALAVVLLGTNAWFLPHIITHLH
jgi:hypothetical protein